MTHRSKVVVDLLFVSGERGGMETYARELLPRTAGHLPDVDLVALTSTTGKDEVAGWFPGEVHALALDADSRALWAAAEVLAVERRARRAGADLLWCPANFGPAGRRVATLVTVHDVTMLELPNRDLHQAAQAVTSWLVRRAARGATRILTVSEDAARGISRALDVPADRIDVVPNGAQEVRPGIDVEAALAGLPPISGRPVVLSTGNRMPHKNFDGLLRALAAIPPGQRPTTVVTGSRRDVHLREQVRQLGLEDDVVLLGWVTQDQLEALFASATVYVCPSLAEGFGLPVADAMKRGVPVLANDIPVLREVGGTAARYADATDPAALAKALVSIVADPAERELMSAAGRARATLFTWDASAERTARVLARTLDEVQARRG
ncbi:glycosyltransferase family 4 protein [Antribacter sp. KLBMP9083]|uniref:Glycosyltransferase family 4 protein n=1 Tax=Antribacter soli TaxID=2910976 RepID=A0AA41QAR5_9MICO|nr:glycosyltransferase family 1 protein [Antribacter soli]MCF4119692.1 glycosyltransferase family 4 protein [Antribacter soli]MCF4123454.1 glycosyltransferase family 4 protein [Antribacter soli]